MNTVKHKKKGHKVIRKTFKEPHHHDVLGKKKKRLAEIKTQLKLHEIVKATAKQKPLRRTHKKTPIRTKTPASVPVSELVVTDANAGKKEAKRRDHTSSRQAKVLDPGVLLPEPQGTVVEFASAPKQAAFQAQDAGRAKFRRKQASSYEADAGRARFQRKQGTRHAPDAGRTLFQRKRGSQHEPDAGRTRFRRKSSSGKSAVDPVATKKKKRVVRDSNSYRHARLQPLSDAEWACIVPPSYSSAASLPLDTQLAPTREQQGPDPLPTHFIDCGLPTPDGYGFDHLVALPRDPRWIYGYLELNGGLIERVSKAHGYAIFDTCAWALRLHRISENIAIDTEIDPSVGNWYLHVGRAGNYQLELGLLTPDGEWLSLLASSLIETPMDGLSEDFDEGWRLGPADDECLRSRLLRRGSAEDAADRRALSGFQGASGRGTNSRLVENWLGGPWSGSASNRPCVGSWAWSFQGASGRISSRDSGGFVDVGWIIGADGNHQPVLVRPSHGDGPNWNEQRNLPQHPSKTSAPHFKVKLPRVLHCLTRPQPTLRDPPRSASSVPK